MIRLTVLALLFVTNIAMAEQPGFVTVDDSPSNYAWWLRARYHPFSTTVRGIPVKRLDRKWCKANEFTKPLFPTELLNEDGTDILKGPGLSFSLTDTFGPRAAKLTVLVGAYERCDSEKGLFLLILERKNKGKKAIFLDQFPNEKALPSVRKVSQNSIELWWCVECDNFQELEWQRKEGRFEWKPFSDPYE